MVNYWKSTKLSKRLPSSSRNHRISISSSFQAERPVRRHLLAAIFWAKSFPVQLPVRPQIQTPPLPNRPDLLRLELEVFRLAQKWWRFPVKQKSFWTDSQKKNNHPVLFICTTYLVFTRLKFKFFHFLLLCSFIQCPFLLIYYIG